MKVPLIWLNDYVKTDKSPRGIAASFTQLGLMLDKPFDDTGVLDLEHRMDRADWLSIIGCARDFAAFEGVKLNYPETNNQNLPRIPARELVEIKVESPVVRRFYTRIVKGVKVGPSPSWLKERLEAYGIRSINNVVDITNFVMVEYGQPLHAQDLSKLKKREIVIRTAKKGESLTTILGTKVDLDSSVCVLASGGTPTVITGVVGGLETSVTNTSLDLILDAGNYDQSTIRRTSRRLKIINETVSRCDKFLDPRLCEIAVDRASYLLRQLCGATVYDNVDYYPTQVKPLSQTLTFARLEKISGLTLSTSQIKKILTSLEYTIKSENTLGLTVEIPYFRTDVEVEDDLIADILRIYNYADIPVAPLNSPVPSNITPPILTFEEKLRDLMVAQGAHEHITTPLVKGVGDKREIILSNALSSDQNALRTSMVPKLAEIISNYAKHKVIDSKVFEIGKTFELDKDDYIEHRELSVVTTSDPSSSLATLLFSLGISPIINNEREIIVNNNKIGVITSHSYTLNTDALFSHALPYPPITNSFSHTTTRDLSLLTPPHITYYDITTCLRAIPSHWQKIESLGNPVRINNHTNYLLQFTWDSPKHIDADIKLSLQTLKKKLNIDSKS